MNKEYKVKIVKCKCGAHSELFVEDELITFGSQFHDHIDDEIKGFLMGLRFSGNDVSITSEECVCHFCADYQNKPLDK